MDKRVHDLFHYEGQAAMELRSTLSGYRDFIHVYYIGGVHIAKYHERFPHTADSKQAYRVVRFHVKNELIENDLQAGPDDLINKQVIWVCTEDDLEYILKIWNVISDELLSIRVVDSPV